MLNEAMSTKQIISNLLRLRSSSRSRRRRQEALDRQQPVHPVACTTKRTGSVLGGSYLFPLRLNADGTMSCTKDGDDYGTAISPNAATINTVTMAPKKHRRSIFGPNLKKKIGPMELTLHTSRPGMEADSQNNNNHIANNNNNNNNSTLDNCYLDSSMDDGTKKKLSLLESSSLEQSLFGQDFEMMPTSFLSSAKRVEGTAAIPHPLELEALKTLNNWGITEEMLKQAASAGARNELIGIYRIIVHRLQMQRERERRSATVDGGKDRSSGRSVSAKEADQKRRQSRRSRCPSSSKCVIL